MSEKQKKEPFFGARDGGPCVPSMGCGAAIALCLLLIPFKCSIDYMRAKAVERGAAEWKVDQKTGHTTFTWKEIKP